MSTFHGMYRAVSIPNVGDPVELVAFAREIEAGGWDGFFVWDHLQIDAAANHEIVDPWMLLAAVAEQTERVRLGPMVAAVSRRRPWQVAKQIVTLDRLSGGRTVVGVGLGAPVEDEFGAFGEETELRTRAERTDEALIIIDRVLRGEAVDHRGVHYEMRARLSPGAVQSPRPPIWTAATPPHRKPLERARRWDGVVCNVKLDEDAMPLRPEELRDYVPDLLADADRDVVTAQHPEHHASEYEEVGVDWLMSSWFPGPDWLSQFRDFLPSLRS